MGLERMDSNSRRWTGLEDTVLSMKLYGPGVRTEEALRVRGVSRLVVNNEGQ